MRGELIVANMTSCLDDVERLRLQSGYKHQHCTESPLTRQTTAVVTVHDFKMLQRLLFAVCVLLVVASLDAKKLHKKTSVGKLFNHSLT